MFYEDYNYNFKFEVKTEEEDFVLEPGLLLEVENKSSNYDACFIEPIAVGPFGELVYRKVYVLYRELSNKVWRSRDLRAFSHSIVKMGPISLY